jgi:hypothetical protein
MRRDYAAYGVPPRPTLVDYLFLLAGVGLSLYLLRLGPMSVEAQPGAVPPVYEGLIPFLPDLMRLPEGILLVWPFFFATQRILGRSQPLTSCEWLWVLAWIGVALLTGLSAWEQAGTLPEFLQSHVKTPRYLWYVVFVPSMAALAIILSLLGLLTRRPAPWTHTFGLALLTWPVAPLVGILLLGKFV